MCFLIFSEGSFPDPQFLPDFDYILPYPAPMKIDGVYQRILINWEGEQPTEAQLSSDAKIFSYFQNLLTPQEATSLDSTQLQYELYVSTFQFQYRPALMGQNGSQTLLQAQSINIFNTVKSSLYERNMGYERFPTTGTTTYENWMRFRQPLAQETDDPCGYEMIDYFLRDVIINTFLFAHYS